MGADNRDFSPLRDTRTTIAIPAGIRKISEIASETSEKERDGGKKR